MAYKIISQKLKLLKNSPELLKVVENTGWLFADRILRMGIGLDERAIWFLYSDRLSVYPNLKNIKNSNHLFINKWLLFFIKWSRKIKIQDKLIMQYQIFVQNQSERKFLVSVVGISNLRAEGITEEKALSNVKSVLES